MSERLTIQHGTCRLEYTIKMESSLMLGQSSLYEGKELVYMFNLFYTCGYMANKLVYY